MILVDEAIERLNFSGRPYGVSIRPWSRRSKHRRHIGEIEEAIAPLRLPMELRSFWNTWDPSTVQWPCLEGFIPIHALLEQRERERPIAPAILLPIADWANTRLWIELASASHPGGRIFRGEDNDSHVDLWAFGMSGLFDLLALAFERDLVDTARGGLHRTHLEALATREVREFVSASAPRRIESVDRSRFPAHWLSADGLPPDHFNLRGPSHTVDEFKTDRQANPGVRATLRGYYSNTVCGGPIRGCVGTFHDDSGEIQVFVPLLAGLAGAIGQDGEVELDVLSFTPHGSELDQMSARNDMQVAADMGVSDLGNDVILRLTEQLKDLDTSIVVTGLRPIR